MSLAPARRNASTMALLALTALGAACATERPLDVVIPDGGGAVDEPGSPPGAGGLLIPPKDQGGTARPGARCEDGETRVPAPDERTSAGVTPKELVAAVSGKREAPLTWRPDPQSIRLTPAGGTTTVTVETAVAGAPRFVESRVVGGVGNERLACPGRMEVDATVKIRTADGALDEVWTGSLRALSAGPAATAATFTIDLIAAPPRGTFRASWIEVLAIDRVSLNLSATIGAGRTEGQIILARSRQYPAADGAAGRGEGMGATVAQWSGGAGPADKTTPPPPDGNDGERPAGTSESPPGPGVFDLQAPGVGACAGKTLADVIAAVHAARPALADIRTLWTKDRAGDGNGIHAFATKEGFALAFKRGGGDCPAGCTDNEYWYFTTDARCAPAEVGHHRAAWVPRNCIEVTGTPMWGVPRPTDPAIVCGADNRPQQISGTYQAQGVGSRTACTEKKGAEPSQKADLPLTIVIAQNADDLGRGTVTLTGTGVPQVDGQPLPATFTRRRVSVERRVSNLPAMCIDQHETTLALDLESGAPGTFTFFEVRALGCPPSQDYCKGLLSLQLTLKK